MHLFQPFLLQQDTATHVRRTTPVGVDRLCNTTLAEIPRDQPIKLGLLKVSGNRNHGLPRIVVGLYIIQQVLASQTSDRLLSA